MQARRWGLVAAAALLALLLFHPLRHASPVLEDYFYLALGTHLGNPLPLAIQDSTGSFFFRPVVMLFWWVTSAITRSPGAHYAVNIALHVANGLLVLALLRRMKVSFVPAALAGLAFVAHVTTYSAAAWLSDRFDLFTLAFGLGALIAVQIAHERGVNARTLAAVAALALACVFSKETGSGIVAVAGLAALWPAPGNATTLRSRVILAITIAACIGFALALRGFVLRDAVQGIFLREGVVATLWSGFDKWFDALPHFIMVAEGPRLAAQAWTAALAGLAVIAVLPMVWRSYRDTGLIRIVVMGLLLALVTAVAQAPVANLTGLELEGAAFDFRRVAASRLFYVPLAGLCLAGGALGEAIARAPMSAWLKRIAVSLMAIGAIALVTQSRAVGRDVHAFSERSGPHFLAAALEALRQRPALTPGCKVYFLGTPPHAMFFRQYLQVTVMQALPRGHPATKCFLLSEHTPWYNLLAFEGLPAEPQRPLDTMLVGGKPFLPLTVGNLRFHYLNVPDNDAVRDDPSATFFAWDDGRFVDVTADVRARRREVKFFDNRPPG